jgi:hypothetical protein
MIMENNGGVVCKAICEVVLMHQTKYFGLSMFLNYLCIFYLSLTPIWEFTVHESVQCHNKPGEANHNTWQ